MALLDGLLHCYSPSLGPTGYRLIDRGPRRVHGVAAAGISATSWTGSQGKWAIKAANGATERFTGLGRFVAGNRTVAMWARAQVTLAQYTEGRVAFWQGGDTETIGGSFGIIMFRGVSNVTGYAITQWGDSVLSSLGNDNKWHLVAGANYGTTWEIYIDGVLIATNTMTTVQTTGPSVLMGGAPANPYGWSNYAWEGEVGECAYWSRLLGRGEHMELFRRGDGAIGRMLTGQTFPKRRLSQAITAGGATPWLYARRRSQIIGSGGIT